MRVDKLFIEIFKPLLFLNENLSGIENPVPQ